MPHTLCQKRKKKKNMKDGGDSAVLETMQHVYATTVMNTKTNKHKRYDFKVKEMKVLWTG